MRRSALAVVLVLWSVAPAAGRAPPGSRCVFSPVDIADARWTTGFWADGFQTCRTATIPAMRAIMEGTEHSQFLHNFGIAAGLQTGKHRGPPWNDGDFCKWLEAVAAVYAVTKEPALDKRMDAAIAIIATAQR